MLVLAPRDFIILIRLHNFPDGSQGLVSFSIDDYQDAPAANNGVIRADMKIGGWYFKTLKPEGYQGQEVLDIEAKDHVTLAKNFAVTDMKGSIPKFVANMVCVTHRQSMVSFEKLIKKKFEDGTYPTQQETFDKYACQPGFMEMYKDVHARVQNHWKK